MMNEFKVNEYITVKLLNKIINEKLKIEYKEPVIFVDEKPFECIGMYLILQSKRKSIYFENNDHLEKFDLVEYVEEIDESDPEFEYSGHAPKGVKSVDDIFGELVASLQEHEFQDLYEGAITAEEKFWGYCSNLQVWAENDYNTDLLYTKIAFPLLKCLIDVGDPIAKEFYKKELSRQFKKVNFNAIIFLIKEGFTADFNKQELIKGLTLYASNVPPSKNQNDSQKDRQLLSLRVLFNSLKNPWVGQTEESKRVVEVLEDIMHKYKE